MKRYIYLMIIGVLIIFSLDTYNNFMNTHKGKKIIMPNGVKLLSSEIYNGESIITYVKGNQYGIIKFPKDNSKIDVRYNNSSLVINDNFDKIAYSKFEDEDNDKVYLGIFILDKYINKNGKNIDVEFLNKETGEKQNIQIPSSKTNGTIVSYNKKQDLGCVEKISIIDSENVEIYSRKYMIN